MVAQGKNDISFLRSTIVYAIVLYFFTQRDVCGRQHLNHTHRGAKRQCRTQSFNNDFDLSPYMRFGCFYTIRFPNMSMRMSLLSVFESRLILPQSHPHPSGTNFSSSARLSFDEYPHSTELRASIAI